MEQDTGTSKLAKFIDKNPRAAFSFGAVLVIIWLAGVTVSLVIFIKDQNQTANEKDAAEIRELKAENATLRANNITLVRAVEVAKSDALREQLTLKDAHNAELIAFNKQLKDQTGELARELDKYRKTAVTTKRFSETVKTLQTQ